MARRIRTSVTLIPLVTLAILSVVSIPIILATASEAAALELSGILVIQDIADSMRVDFSRLDTPTCTIGLRRDTVTAPDMILAYGQNANLILRAPYTPNSDGMSISINRFSGSISTNIDSLRLKFLPIAASVNPECRQSGHCDTAGGGFFLRTLENGVVFWRPVGMYIGGIDRFYLFWAYSSDGTFGHTEIQRNPENMRINIAAPTRTKDYALYDLQGRRWGRDGKYFTNKSPGKSWLVVEKNVSDRQTRICIRVRGQ